MMSALLLSLFKLLLSTGTFTPTVQLGNTTVTGKDLSELKQELFGGIPFAEKPLGNLRFSPPVLKTSLDSVTFDATALGPPCLGLIPPTWVADNNTSEDCLSINVIRPAGLSSDAQLPVMVWIYGGGFIGGSANIYNGSTLVARGVERGTPIIYVNFNYRLGPLGFPQGSEAEKEGSLNLGLKDQLAALKWVQANIGAFGGDKSKVTVFGESAGAVSIGFLYLNSGLEKLARAAIFESGSAATLATFNATRREDDWTNFVSAVPECSSLAGTPNTLGCLRNASSSTLLSAFAISQGDANEQFPWVPAIDSPKGIIPELPSKLFAKGAFSKIPFITGGNLDEGTFLSSATINSSDTIREWLITNYTTTPSDVSALEAAATSILQLYPDDPALGSPYNTGNDTFGLSSQYKRLSAILGDLLFHSLRRLWIQSASSHGVKTFGYLFTDAAPAQVPSSLGVTHSLEIPYLQVGSLDTLFPGIQLSPAAQDLSLQMLDYWISFATSLDPNDAKGSNRPQWPRYTSKTQELIQLDSGNLTVIPDDYRGEQIAFINSHSVIFRR